MDVSQRLDLLQRLCANIYFGINVKCRSTAGDLRSKAIPRCVCLTPHALNEGTGSASQATSAVLYASPILEKDFTVSPACTAPLPSAFFADSRYSSRQCPIDQALPSSGRILALESGLELFTALAIAFTCSMDGRSRGCQFHRL